MTKLHLMALAGIYALRHYGALATPVWPSSSDELEDIMFLNTGYRARGFAVAVTPCSFSAQGSDRIAAAEWIRTAFHDTATGNVYTGIGGLDASLAFETNGGENIGSAFNTTLATFSPFLTSRSSMADIIAMGVYTGVRSCGGPVVPIKTGRIDATAGGPEGVPLPQNSLGTFENQFLRIGFNTTEMIAVTACGHTLGGVHAANFPQIVPAGTVADDFQHFDTTTAFDEKVVSEFVSGNTANSLVVGPSVGNGRNSDGRVFAADGNVTVKSMTDPATFSSICSTMLQKLIDVVPSGVTLTDPITVYEVKPVALQLTLLSGGSDISFTGEIRVRTTVRASNQISSLKIIYKDREGASSCGDCSLSTTFKGTAAGFDDSFAFYSFSSSISSNSSISSFTVLITLVSGGTEQYDNGGGGFPVQDQIMLQTPQSCISAESDADGKTNITVVAAVRDASSEASVNLDLTLKTNNPASVVPSLKVSIVSMVKQSTIGLYSLYSASYALDASQTENTIFDVSLGTASDSFKSTNNLPTQCSALSPDPPSTTPTPSGYSYEGCYTDSVSQRAFTGAVFYNNNMTVAKCATSCGKWIYFGIENGGECYCGDTQDASSVEVGDSDCSSTCPGDKAEFCGAGNRLSVYKNLEYINVTNPTIDGYEYQGCYNDSTSRRTLSQSSTTSDSLTVGDCAAFCNGSTYFGTEYGRECYCGSTLSESSILQSQADCSYACSGSDAELCGAGNRISIYRKTSV